jgi:hypothetical protein
MLPHPTHDRLIALGLVGMAKALEEQRQLPAVASLTFEERLARTCGLRSGRSAHFVVVAGEPHSRRCFLVEVTRLDGREVNLSQRDTIFCVFEACWVPRELRRIGT